MLYDSKTMVYDFRLDYVGASLRRCRYLPPPFIFYSFLTLFRSLTGKYFSIQVRQSGCTYINSAAESIRTDRFDQNLEARICRDPLLVSFLDKIHDFTESATRSPIIPSPHVPIGDSPITAYMLHPTPLHVPSSPHHNLHLHSRDYHRTYQSCYLISIFSGIKDFCIATYISLYSLYKYDNWCPPIRITRFVPYCILFLFQRVLYCYILGCSWFVK